MLRIRFLLFAVFISFVTAHSVSAQTQTIAPKPVTPVAAASVAQTPPAQMTPMPSTAQVPAVSAATPQNTVQPGIVKPMAVTPAAQTTAATAGSPLSADAEAQKLVETLRPEASMDKMEQAIAAPIITKLGANLPPDKAKIMQQIVMEEMMNAMHEMRPDLLQHAKMAYLQNFTADELHAINQFYESPAGKKIVSLMPQVVAEGAQRGREEALKVMPSAMQRIKDRLGQAGISIPNLK